MKLISIILEKKLELYNELELNHQYAKAIWNFYCVYNIACAYLGFNPDDTNAKNKLISLLISTGDNKYYFRLKKYMQEDVKIINNCLDAIQSIKEQSDYYGDLDLPDMIAISVLDDN